MNRTNTLLIKTPEGVVFAQTLAGPVTRFLAWLIDFTCASTLLLALNMIVAFTAIVSSEFASALSIILYFTISIGYAMTLEWLWRGQTIGKRVMRLRVVDAEGMRLRFSQVATRNLLRFIDSPVFVFSSAGGVIPLPTFYLFGGIAAMCTRKAQRLGDLAAGTVVIRIPKISEPNLEQLGADKYNSLRAHPHLCARLRQRVSPAEASAALQAILRRDEFEAVARVQLFSDLAGHFKGKVTFPTEAMEGIADEQYMRNVVDVLYRTDIKRERAASATTAPAEGSPQNAQGTLVA